MNLASGNFVHVGTWFSDLRVLVFRRRDPLRNLVYLVIRKHGDAFLGGTSYHDAEPLDRPDQ